MKAAEIIENAMHASVMEFPHAEAIQLNLETMSVRVLKALDDCGYKLVQPPYVPGARRLSHQGLLPTRSDLWRLNDER